MPDVIGSAFYELEARDSRARSTIDKLEQHIRASGGKAEPQYAAPVTAAVDRTAGAWNRAAVNAQKAGDALPGTKVGAFATILEGTRGKVGAFSDRVGELSIRLKDRLGGVLDGVRGKLGAFGGMLGQLGSQAVGALATPLGLGVAGGIAASIIGIGIASLGASAQMETYRTQFVTLLGSVDAAADRLAELSKFAAATPFELPEVVQASRTLEVFTQGALSTGDSLRLIGDAAASVNAPFSEVAFWTGRLYAAMKGGQPIGEMTLRLSELGILAPETRTQIEQMAAGISKGTISINDAWPQVETAFGRFAGGMERQSGTLAGRFSTFMDDVRMALARFGDRIAPMAKTLLPELGKAISGVIDLLGGLTDILGGPVIGNILKGIGVLAEMADNVQDTTRNIGDFVRGLVGLPASLDPGTESVRAIGDAVRAAGGDMQEAEIKMTHLADTMGVDTQEVADRIAAVMARMGIDFNEALVLVGRGWDTLPSKAEDGAVRAGRAWQAAMEGEAGASADAVNTGIVAPTEQELAKIEAIAEAAARAGSASYSEEIAGNADNVQNAWEAMLHGIHTELDKTERIADIKAKLSSEKLRHALESEDPFLAAQAEATRLTLENELELLENNAYTHARRTGKSLPDALRDNKQAAILHAHLMAEAAGAELGRDWRAAGGRAGMGWGDGLSDSITYVRGAAYGVAAAAARQLVGQSPPPEGPLHFIDRGAKRTVRAWGEAALSERGYVRSVGARLAGAFSPEFGLSRARGDRGSLAFAGAPSMGLGPLGGVTIAPHFSSVFPPSPEQARAAAQAIIPELQQELRRFGFVH